MTLVGCRGGDGEHVCVCVLCIQDLSCTWFTLRTLAIITKTQVIELLFCY